MDKPKIYGVCPAGCLFETIHREEFEKAATNIPVLIEDGAVRVAASHKYRIKTAVSEGAYTCAVTFVQVEYDESEGVYVDGGTVSIPIAGAYDKYRDCFYIEVLGIEPGSDSESYVLTYELNGNRTQTIFYDTEYNWDNLDFDICVLSITNALAVYRYNSDANMTAEKGDSVYIRYASDSVGTDASETWAEGMNYIGIYVGQEAPAYASSYKWIKFIGDTGAGVPEVTTADNGKILCVVDGAWAAVAIEDSPIKTYIDEKLGGS